VNLLVVSTETQFETNRILEEAKKLKIQATLLHPSQVNSLKGFSHVLFRQIRGFEKTSMKLARKAIKQKLVVVDRRLGTEGDRNKKQNYDLFKKAGFFVPKTFFSEQITRKELDSVESNFVVIKPIKGKRGQDIFRVKKKDFFSFCEKLEKKKFLAQEYVFILKELRVFVIGKKVLGAIKSESDSWIYNFAKGATPKNHRLNKKIKTAALKACSAVKTDIAGVDLAYTKHGFFVLEVNRSPGFKAFESTTKKNAAKEILKFVLSK
jgi:RimK family alpha-L-glutamate ligase